MNLKEAKQRLMSVLRQIYDEREAAGISEIVLEFVTGLSRSSRLTKNNQVLTDEEIESLVEIVKKLENHTPVQYATGEAWFYKRKFKVAPGVLIPRPETEELVDRIITDFKGKENLSIMDIGTGSGNIPVSLALELNATVFSCDISDLALAIAKENLSNLKANVQLIKADILQETEWHLLPDVNLIVSNPPYIAIEEKQSLDKHVIEYEPEIALFPPGKDALIFYKKIVQYGLQKLLPEGCIYVEINSMLGNQTMEVFLQTGYQAELIKDMYGNDRIIKAVKN